jgi:hypothetical protein
MWIWLLVVNGFVALVGSNSATSCQQPPTSAGGASPWAVRAAESRTTPARARDAERIGEFPWEEDREKQAVV